MIFGLLIVYLVLKLKSKNMVNKIKNQARTSGEVNGYEIKVDSKKKWTFDIVSFLVDGEMFLAKKTSSPFYLSSRSKCGTKYDDVYDKTCPSNNIIIDDIIFQQIRKSLVMLSCVYLIAGLVMLISYMFMK